VPVIGWESAGARMHDNRWELSGGEKCESVARNSAIGVCSRSTLRARRAYHEDAKMEQRRNQGVLVLHTRVIQNRLDYTRLLVGAPTATEAQDQNAPKGAVKRGHSVERLQ